MNTIELTPDKLTIIYDTEEERNIDIATKCSEGGYICTKVSGTLENGLMAEFAKQE